MNREQAIAAVERDLEICDRLVAEIPGAEAALDDACFHALIGMLAGPGYEANINTLLEWHATTAEHPSDELVLQCAVLDATVGSGISDVARVTARYGFARAIRLIFETRDGFADVFGADP